MNIDAIACKIISLENELEILRISIKELFGIKSAKKTHNFASLYNILKGKGKFTEQEIHSAHIKLPHITS